MPILAILTIVQAVFALAKTGILGYLEVKSVIEKYQDKEATVENIEALRLELLSAAQVSHAVDDPRIRELLAADGIDPETLRIT